MSGTDSSLALARSRSIAVIGSGAMGAGIAQVAAAAGYTVHIFDTRPGAVAAAIENIAAMFETLSEKGRMTSEHAQSASKRLHVASSLSALAEAGLVVEAVVEDLDVKRKLFEALEDIVADDCIFASNTSSISITSIAAMLRVPQRLVGMHFFNPVPLMSLVEVISGLATDDAVTECVYATAQAWGKEPVYAKSSPGFIVNRVARPYYAEALRILSEQGAEPATIDAVLREAGGFRMGPFELMDLIGHDVNFAVTLSVFQAFFTDPRFTPSLIQQELVNAGFLGRKRGRGFYTYGEGAKIPVPSTEAPAALSTSPVQLYGTGALVEALNTRLKDIRTHRTHVAEEDDLVMRCGSARLYLTDGRTATQRAHDNQCHDTVLIDLALDFNKAQRIALSCADQCDTVAYLSIVGLLQAAGFAVSRLNDVPGLAVMRTVAMLANEAADTVNQGVCSVADVDMAMQKGVNYPRGPLAWADVVGVAAIAKVLAHLAAAYGEDRYRVSPLISRKTVNGGLFYV